MNNKWIVKHPIPLDVKIRLLCFPFGGSGSSFYLSWAREFAPDVEVVPIQLPGRENRLKEPPLNDLNSLTSEIISAIQNYLDEPYALFGHSMGAFLSFELTREIRRNKLRLPKMIFLSAMRAAHLKETRPPIASLPDDQLIEALNERYDLDVSEESMELLQMMLPTIRADIRCIEKYTYKEEPPLDAPIIGFVGTRDRMVKSHQIEAWALHTTAGFKYYSIDGGHFFINSKRDQLIKHVHHELTRFF